MCTIKTNVVKIRQKWENKNMKSNSLIKNGFFYEGVVFFGNLNTVYL